MHASKRKLEHSGARSQRGYRPSSPLVAGIALSPAQPQRRGSIEGTEIKSLGAPSPLKLPLSPPLASPPLVPLAPPSMRLSSKGTDPAHFATPPLMQRRRSNDSAVSASSAFSDAEVMSLASDFAASEREANQQDDAAPGSMSERAQALREQLGEIMVHGSIEWNEAVAVRLAEGLPLDESLGGTVSLQRESSTESQDSLQFNASKPKFGVQAILPFQPGQSHPGSASKGDESQAIPADGTSTRKLWTPFLRWHDSAKEAPDAVELGLKQADDWTSDGTGVDEMHAIGSANDYGVDWRSISVSGIRIYKELMSQAINSQSIGLLRDRFSSSSFLEQSDASEFQSFLFEVIRYALRGFERDRKPQAKPTNATDSAAAVAGDARPQPMHSTAATADCEAKAASFDASDIARLSCSTRARIKQTISKESVVIELAEEFDLDGTVHEAGTRLAELEYERECKPSSDAESYFGQELVSAIENERILLPLFGKSTREQAWNPDEEDPQSSAQFNSGNPPKSGLCASSSATASSIDTEG